MRSDWLAQYLVNHADALNHTYRLARQGDPTQFANTFSHFIYAALDPLLAALNHWTVEYKVALTESAYACGLAMVRHGWWTPDYQDISVRLFNEVLPSWLSLYPEQAPHLMTQVLNALTHLPRPEQRAQHLSYWQKCLPSPEVTPDALLIVSWLSGLPQFRSAALEAMQRQPELLKTLAIGDSDGFKHPWWRGPQQSWQTRPVALGSSMWMGGMFSCRPRLLVTPEYTFVQSGNEFWQLYIDTFGQLLMPRSSDNIPSDLRPAGTRIPAHLSVHWRPSDEPCQCLERPHDWVVCFHNRYAVMVIPKDGART